MSTQLQGPYKILHHLTCIPAARHIAIIRLLHCIAYDAMTPGLK